MGGVSNSRSTRAEESTRTDTSPDERCGGEGVGSRADETVLLVGCADIDNVVQHPLLNTGCNEASDEGSGGLCGEHDSGRDLIT